MSIKLFIKKNTLKNGGDGYSAVIRNKDMNGNTTATAYMPVNFKKGTNPAENYTSFLIETDNFFLSAYEVELADGKKIGKPKIIICEHTILNDYSYLDNQTQTEPAELQPVNDDTLPF